MKTTTRNALLIGVLASPLLVVNESAVASAEVYSQAGDVTSHSAVLWARCNSEQKSMLTFSIYPNKDREEEKPKRKSEKISRFVTANSDYTASVRVRGLKEDSSYRYQAICKSKSANGTINKVKGPIARFTTAADKHEEKAARFVWVADLAGQGWGRNPELSITHISGEQITGGYVIFEVMHKLNPDFALFQGDMIYADGPIPASKPIPTDVGGGTWINDPALDIVSISLDDFRANWKYSLGDSKMAEFLANTPVYAQWDDHEVTNNWYPGEIMPEGAPYNGIAADVLAERARQAMREYNTIYSDKFYRKFKHGKHMELFLLDERTYRGPNTDNYNSDGIEMLGQEQFQWLKKSLKKSKATWKVISTHDPLGIVTGGADDRDSWGQDDDQVLGRELQLAAILKFIKDENIKNVVFLTSDVHFTAAISYDPDRATFKDFNPFWEFVIGPIHAGAFGPGSLDGSFGPKYEYVRGPSTEGIAQNSPPPNLQSFGAVEIDENGELTVKLVDINGTVLYQQTMSPM